MEVLLGIVKFEKVAQIQHIIRFAGMRPGDERDDASLYGVQCALESHQRVVCYSIVRRSKRHLSYYNYAHTCRQAAVAYAISSNSLSVTELAMSGCHWHDAHVRTLLSEVSYDMLRCILTLHFHDGNIGADGAVVPTDKLKSCNYLQTLHLCNNNIGTDGAAALRAHLKCRLWL